MSYRPLSIRTAVVVAIALTIVAGGLAILANYLGKNDLPNANDHHVSAAKPAIQDNRPIRTYDGRLNIGENPAFNCPDGRNEGRLYNAPADLHQFVPCINGSLLIRVYGDGNLQVLNSTDKIEVHKIGADLREITTPTEGWRVHSFARKEADTVNDQLEKIVGRTYYQLTYDSAPTLTPFRTYWNKNGTWELVVNLDDQAFDNRAVDVLFTWTDPERRTFDAPVPFSWNDVQKDNGYSLN